MLRHGSAAAGLVSGGAEWGVEWPAGLRVDRQLTAGAELLGALERCSLRHVVPGHGPVLSPDEAKRIGHEDLRYFERLGLAAREAADADLSPGYALVHVYAVEPPRKTTLDFDIYDIRGGNARRVLADLGTGA